MINSARLQVLLEIARLGTIAAAAEQLRLSPSAVSHQLATLEREVGVALVERGPRSLRLTPAGCRLAEYGQQVADLMSAARDELTAHGRGTRGSLRVGFFASAGSELLPRALSTFTRGHPDVEVALILGQPHELLPRLDRGDLDLVLVFQHPLDPWRDAGERDVVPLLVDAQLGVLPRTHRLADRTVLRLQDLSGDRWLTTLGTDTEVSVLERAALTAGFRPRVLCRSDHYEVLIGLVRAGVGVALVPALGLRDDRDVVVRPLVQSRLHRDIGVAVRPGNPNPVARQFIGELSAAADQLSREIGRRWPGSGEGPGPASARSRTTLPACRSASTAEPSAPGGNVATTA
ncbi:LysR family transcriptional regulator [Blastococcus xanthinilyticus]|uniref:DNA-binding transcriptional LysR family regulator n=1 Tax=Blastococcus xanthinilyticus TaxID=1564164 RepID=A0A5S5D1E7_9ACTN|nr:LysR family transcriptional regulator [Blastococcus xanthinilyticus]TYP88602.1 DNA-binding transcriptional LysR family regulator [Blastococcus xanthinilyticus]